MSFFTDQNGNIKEGLYDKIAKEEALKFSGYNKAVSNSQVRKIFDELRRLERKIGGNEKNWGNVKPLVKMVKAKTHYNVARALKNNSKLEKEYRAFEDFVIKMVDNVNTYNDFKIFMNFFEAVYAFYYANGGSKTR